MANIVTGAELVRLKREVEMAPHRPKPCENCGRVKTLLHGLCGICGRAAKGLEGLALIKALDDVKGMLERGETTPRGRKPKRTEKVAPPPEEKKTPEDFKAWARDGFRPVQVQGPHEIPLTIRLTIDVTVRVNGV